MVLSFVLALALGAISLGLFMPLGSQRNRFPLASFAAFNGCCRQFMLQLDLPRLFSFGISGGQQSLLLALQI